MAATPRTLIHSPNKTTTTLNPGVVEADSNRTTKEVETIPLLMAAIIASIQTLILWEIQIFLHTVLETKRVTTIRRMNKTMKKMAATLTQSQSNKRKIQLLLRNRPTTSEGEEGRTTTSKRKSQFRRSKSKRSSFLCMRMRVLMTRMLTVVMAAAMRTALSATLVDENSPRRPS